MIRIHRYTIVTSSQFPLVHNIHKVTTLLVSATSHFLSLHQFHKFTIIACSQYSRVREARNMNTFNISQLPSTLQFHNITKITSSRNSQMQDFTICESSQTYKFHKVINSTKLIERSNSQNSQSPSSQNLKIAIPNNQQYPQIPKFTIFTITQHYRNP